MTQRTGQQNKSYWKWLQLLSEALNDAGYSLNDRVVIQCDVPFTKDNLHENTAKAYLSALWPDKTSTTELSTAQMQTLYTYLDKAIAERTGVHIEWPCDESEDPQS